MVHLSPQVCLTWAIMSVLLGIFCIRHLWHCGRFRYLKYDGTRSGLFRFIMIHLHITSTLSLIAFSIGFATMKYKEGFVVVGIEGVVMPSPVESWTPAHRRALYALTVLFSFSWAFEIIVHLGELCRWLFLFNSVSSEGLWLKSKYMHAWIVGSAVIALYMPIVAGIGCNNAMRCQSWTFVAGSFGSLVPTLGFIPMLARFPAYIREMEIRGVDQPTLLQLVKFQELNRTRLAFRLVFIGSFLSLGLDWSRDDVHPLTIRAVCTDIIGFCGCIGYVFSSVLTLPICFPQSMSPQSKSPTNTLENWTTNHTVGSNATGADTSADHGQRIEMGGSYPMYELTLTHSTASCDDGTGDPAYRTSYKCPNRLSSLSGAGANQEEGRT